LPLTDPGQDMTTQDVGWKSAKIAELISSTLA
jgi:hypothetical protein